MTERYIIQRFHPREKKWKDHAWLTPKDADLKTCMQALKDYGFDESISYRIIKREITVRENIEYQYFLTK